MLVNLRMKYISNKKLKLNPPLLHPHLHPYTQPLLIASPHRLNRHLHRLHLRETHKQQLLPKPHTDLHDINNPVLPLADPDYAYIQVLLVYLLLVQLQVV